MNLIWLDASHVFLATLSDFQRVLSSWLNHLITFVSKLKLPSFLPFPSWASFILFPSFARTYPTSFLSISSCFESTAAEGPAHAYPTAGREAKEGEGEQEEEAATEPEEQPQAEGPHPSPPPPPAAVSPPSGVPPASSSPELSASQSTSSSDGARLPPQGQP